MADQLPLNELREACYGALGSLSFPVRDSRATDQDFPYSHFGVNALEANRNKALFVSWLLSQEFHFWSTYDGAKEQHANVNELLLALDNAVLPAGWKFTTPTDKFNVVGFVAFDEEDEDSTVVRHSVLTVQTHVQPVP